MVKKRIKGLVLAGLISVTTIVEMPREAFTMENGNNISTERRDELKNLKVFSSFDEGYYAGETHFIIEEKLRDGKEARRYETTIIYDKLVKKFHQLRDHPQAQNSYYKVDSYTYSMNQNVSASVTFNASYGPFSVSVGALNASSGYIINVPGGKGVKSKPTIRGDVYEVKTKTNEISSSGAVIGTTYKTFNRARNVQGYYRIIN